MEKVSVIVPAYNVEKYIKRCIYSILNQKYKYIEIIIVDDGSTDDTLLLCKELADQDKRIHLISQKNMGVSSARNEGIKNATGEYVLFVDSDDYLIENSIELLVNEKERSNTELVCLSYNLIKTRGRIERHIYQNIVYKDNDYKSNLVKIINDLSCAPWAKLFEMAIIKKHAIKFPIDTPYGEDAIFLYEYMSHIKSLKLGNKIVYNYNYVDSSSQARKYYVNYCEYIFKIINAKLSLIESVDGTDINDLKEQQYYGAFESCLRHYIINASDMSSKCEKIIRSADYFNIINNDSEYARYIQENNIPALIDKWKRGNLKYYISEKIKKIIKMD